LYQKRKTIRRHADQTLNLSALKAETPRRSSSEGLPNTDLGGLVRVGSIHTHLNSGGVKSLLTAATGNSQQDQQDQSYLHGRLVR